MTHVVEYNEPAAPVREVTIQTHDAENILHYVEFYEVLPSTRHDVVLALDGSGSMSAQNKWRAMIEAADIFHDLYREIGHPDDTFGAVRFRWNCSDAIGGNQTAAQPAQAALSVAQDLPAIYAADSPAQCTPIGEGLLQAVTQLAAAPNPAKHVLLLTDGKNNRGASPATVSDDPALGGVSVHTIGLGSGAHIHPPEISALASDHGGSYLETTEPSSILEFFVQILGEMLLKSEMAAVTGDAATIAPGTTKAVFLVAWDDPAVSNDFDLIAPDGTAIDHAAIPSIAGMTITYHPQGTASAHAYFVVEGSGIAGQWTFQAVPAGARKIVVEDLALKVTWSVSPQLGRTGQLIVLTCRITEDGKPYRGAASVTARIRRPGEAQGDLIAREMQKQPVRVAAGDDPNVRQQIVSAVLGRLGRDDFRYDELKETAFEKVADGVFVLSFDATEFDGTYRFDLEARGIGEDGRVRFARSHTRCAVLVGDVAANSGVKVTPAGGNSYAVTLTPVNAKGTMIGPFLAPQLRLTATNGKLVGPLQDNLDGTYTQSVSVMGEGLPQLGLELLGHAVALDTRPGGGAPGMGLVCIIGWALAGIFAALFLVALLS